MSNSNTLTAAELIGSPAPFFRLLRLAAADSHQFPDAIEALRTHRLTGIHVRSVFSGEQMHALTHRLQGGSDRLLRTSFPEQFRSWFYGRNLNLMGTNPDSYFAEAEQFHQCLQELMPGEMNLLQRLFEVLSQLDGQRPYRPAPGPVPGTEYMGITVREHAEGGYIPPHCDNEQRVRLTYDHLSTLVGNHMYSAVLMIAPAENGGCLKIYDRVIESAESEFNSGASAGKGDLSGVAAAEIPSAAGDVVIVDSGRYVHEVTPVVGKQSRWVACSFMSRALDRDAVYCWG